MVMQLTPSTQLQSFTVMSVSWGATDFGGAYDQLLQTARNNLGAGVERICYMFPRSSPPVSSYVDGIRTVNTWRRASKPRSTQPQNSFDNAPHPRYPGRRPSTLTEATVTLCNSSSLRPPTTLSSLFHMLEMTKENPDLAGIPNYTSALAFELRRGPAPEDRDFVRIKFKNGTSDDFETHRAFGHKSDIAATEFIYRIVNYALTSQKQRAAVCSSGLEAPIMQTAQNG
ncbi:hypothetical protein BDR03DRAFT_1017370 [Suillus americanus]|nr:hypothetical protein BDR03DRAFT_1017370 [Suillus americanus]